MTDRSIKVLIIWLLMMPASRLVVAQNLIPDSSFEMNKFVPMEFSAVHASNYWSIPSRGTSDLFCKCDRKTKINASKLYSEVDVPQNTMGYQQPHSGTCYGGMFVFSHGYYREYLQTPLKEPLQKNTKYLFTMYISLADYSTTSIDQLGVCFLRDKSDYPFSEVLTDLDPVYIKIDEEVGHDTEDWHAVSATYTAQGGESYVLFGSFTINKITKTKFKPPGEIKTRINLTAERDAYYFIDDVSLVELTPNEKDETLEEEEIAPEIEIPADTLLVMKNVLFKTNETTLLPSSFKELDALVNFLRKHPDSAIEIFGHTDNSGNETNNKTLSTGRAKTVADYFISKGIQKNRIHYSGYGSATPVATNDTEEGKQQNRRVEFRINKL